VTYRIILHAQACSFPYETGAFNAGKFVRDA